MITVKKLATQAASITLALMVSACTTTEHSAQSAQANGHHQANPQYHVGPITSYTLLEHYKVFAENKTSDETSVTDLELLDLANQLNNRKVVVVFGTWCHDSQREVPRLLNLLDKVRDHHSEVQFELELIGTAPYQLRDKNLIKKYSLTAVPTIMLFDNGQEIGRVVEHSKISLAADIVNMKL